MADKTQIEAARKHLLKEIYALWQEQPGAVPSWEESEEPNFTALRSAAQELVEEGLATSKFGPDTIYNFKLTRAGRDSAEAQKAKGG